MDYAIIAITENKDGGGNRLRQKFLKETKSV
jgi:hypothetical protein